MKKKVAKKAAPTQTFVGAMAQKMQMMDRKKKPEKKVKESAKTVKQVSVSHTVSVYTPPVSVDTLPPPPCLCLYPPPHVSVYTPPPMCLSIPPPPPPVSVYVRGVGTGAVWAIWTQFP